MTATRVDPSGGRTPDGRALLIVQSNTGLLFRVDPRTGHTMRVDLGAATLANGDGLLLEGRRLYVVQNRLNRIAWPSGADRPR